MSKQGIIFHIQRYTIHDGPGIRTELFLKGCPLHCKWCSNPESHKAAMEVGVYSSKCIGKDKCGYCIKNCKNQNIFEFQNNQLIGIHPSTYTACADICPADAIKRWGQVITTEEAMEIIRRDIPYYESSSGGVTFSGGDPLVQIDFVADVLKCCKAENIHTCVESTLCMDWNTIARTLPYTDLYITDMKHMDSEIHKKYTGIHNEKILENITRLTAAGKPVIIRIPVIPTINDTLTNMEAAADFILEKLHNQIEQLQLLPFMRLGEEKYKSLGMPYPMRHLEVDREQFDSQIKEFVNYFQSKGINCIAGTTTKEQKK